MTAQAIEHQRREVLARIVRKMRDRKSTASDFALLRTLTHKLMRQELRAAKRSSR